MSKKSFIEKLFFLLLFICIFCLIIIGNYVNAYSKNVVSSEIPTVEIGAEEISKEEIIAHETEKIMSIDVSSGKTTEYNIDLKNIAPILEKMNETQNFSTDLFLNNQSNNKYQDKKTFRAIPFKSLNYTYYTCINNEQVSSQKPICRITCNAYSPCTTGFLIGDKYLATAAHCVLNQDGTAFSNLSASAGYRNGTYLNTMGFNTIYYSNNWPTYGPASSFDWAIVELDGNYGSNVGVIYCTKYNNYSDMVNVSDSAWGYPGESVNGEHLCYSNGSVSSANSWTFDSSCHVEGGFSGGPTRISDNTAIGINIAKYSDYSLKSVRFNDNLFNLILDLLNN